MAQKATAFVHRVIEGGPAFALREDTDECIYIPKTIAYRMGLREQDHINVLLVVNELEPANTPWFCVSVVPQNTKKSTNL